MRHLAIACLLCGAAFAANAQDPDATDRVEAADVSRPQLAADADDATIDRNCLRDTGSLITRHRNARLRADQTVQDAGGRSAQAGRDPECSPAMGRSYSRRDIERTGARDLADALRMLDPAIH